MDKRKCLKYDALGRCVDWDRHVKFVDYKSNKSQHGSIHGGGGGGIKPKPHKKPDGPSPPTPTPPQPQPSRPRRVLPTPSNMAGFKAKPTIKRMPEEELEKAKMSRAARIFRDDGHESAQEYLDENDINHTIDPELSDDHGLVLKNNETGKVKVAYRGTDVATPSDLITDGALGLGVPTNQIKQMNQARNQMDAVISKYGKPEETIGFSLGGNKAIRMGEEFGVPSTSFNPFISAKEIFNKPTQQHNIYRTTEDFATLGLTVANDGYNVNSINPLRKSVNPYQAHALDNFIDMSERRSAAHHDLAEATMNASYDAGEHKLMNDIHNSVQNGDSLEDYVNSLQETDMFTTKPHQFEKILKLWKESGGKITDEEQKVIDTRHEGYKGDLPTSESVVEPTPKVNPLFGEDLRPSRVEPPQTLLTDRLDELYGKPMSAYQKAYMRAPPPTDNPLVPKETTNPLVGRDDRTPPVRQLSDEPAFDPRSILDEPGATTNPLSVDPRQILDHPDAKINPLAQDEPPVQQHDVVPMKTSRKQRDDFRRKSPEERQNIVDGKMRDAADMTNITDAYTEPHAIVRDGIMKQMSDGLAENLHPTNMAGGLIAGMVGDKVANLLDPGGAKTHATAHNFLSGGIAGGVGHYGMAKLSGQAVTAGEIGSSMASGGVGMAVGGLTQKGVADLLKRAGANKETQESVSDIAGGSAGFASATATGKAIQAGSKAIQAARETAQAAKASQSAGEGIEMTGMGGEAASGASEAAAGGAEAAGAGIEAASAGGAEAAGASLTGAGESIGSAIAAAEEFGGGELAAETGGLSIVAAAGIGALVGGASYAIGHAKEIGQGIEHGAEAVGHGIASGARSVGHFFKHLF